MAADGHGDNGPACGLLSVRKAARARRWPTKRCYRYAMAESPIVIIGAGPAGLTAAYELMKHGRPATILEADNCVGGLSRTERYQGYRFDIGGHRFFSKVPLINDVWQEILGEDFLLRPRAVAYPLPGSLFLIPAESLDAIAGLGLVEALRVILSYTKAQLFPYKPAENLEEWVANRFGYRLYQIFFGPIRRKYGACRVPILPRTGQANASRISPCGRHCELR